MIEKPAIGHSARSQASFLRGSAFCRTDPQDWAVLFSNCSKSPQRFATIVRYTKATVREGAQRCPPKPPPPSAEHARSAFPCGCGCNRGAQQVNKKLFPVPCHGSRQRRRTDYQHPPDRPQLIRGFHTAGSTAFLLLSTVLPAFCCNFYQKLARFDTMLLASFRAFLYNENQEKPVPGTGQDAVC